MKLLQCNGDLGWTTSYLFMIYKYHLDERKSLILENI